ncbi:phage terminase small subunit [Streptomyces rubrogriseus]
MVTPGPRRDPTRPYSRANREGGKQPRAALVVLPLAGCDLPVPPMPPGRTWTEAEEVMWVGLWESPQATQYDDSYIPLVALYVQIVCQSLSSRATAGLASEARYLADHLGLSPAGLRTLGWVMEQPDTHGAELHALPAPVSDVEERRARLTS